MSVLNIIQGDLRSLAVESGRRQKDVKEAAERGYAAGKPCATP